VCITGTASDGAKSKMGLQDPAMQVVYS
jgi:hypothetical protein